MGRMEDSAHQENMLSAARAGKFTQADLEAACALAVAGALKGRELQVERATEVLRAERDQARRSVEYAVRLLTRIHSLLYPPRTTDNDGRVWEFKHPGDPHAILQELSDRIRALPDEVAKLDGPNV